MVFHGRRPRRSCHGILERLSIGLVAAALKAAAKIDRLRSGKPLNQKIIPQIFDTNSGMEAIAGLVRNYFRMNDHHIQFNVVTAETLRDAQKHPVKYRDLIMRLSGYSDYFVDLTLELQEEIIRRMLKYKR
jgi:formate C-acetyltransferase